MDPPEEVPFDEQSYNFAIHNLILQEPIVVLNALDINLPENITTQYLLYHLLNEKDF